MVDVERNTALEDVATLVDMMRFRSEQTPNKNAFIFEDEPVSHGTLWEQINRTAAFLINEGIGEGDRVIIVIPNSKEFSPAFYGSQGNHRAH